MTILYEIDHGAKISGKPAVRVRGWFVERAGKRIEAERFVPRYADDKAILTAKLEIERILCTR